MADLFADVIAQLPGSGVFWGPPVGLEHGEVRYTPQPLPTLNVQARFGGRAYARDVPKSSAHKRPCSASDREPGPRLGTAHAPDRAATRPRTDIQVSEDEGRHHHGAKALHVAHATRL